MAEQLKIQQKWEDMSRYAYVLLRSIPKSERFTLGAEIRDTIWKGSRLISRAAYARNRIPLLLELDAEAKVFQAMIRMGHGLKIVSDKQYRILSEMLTEIGKMVGGWIRSQK
jgi:hypothetical protein